MKEEEEEDSPSKSRSGKPTGSNATDDHRIDNSGIFEFGGVPGTGLVMIFFPLLMWLMWTGQVYYNGQLPLPKPGQPFQDFLLDTVNKATEVSATSCATLLFRN